MPSTPGRFEKLRDHRDHFARQRNVLRLLGVDAQPREVLNAVPTGPLRLERRELLEVVAKPGDAAAIVPGPERRLAHRDAAHLGERLVVVRRPRDHVDVWIDVVHGNDGEWVRNESSDVGERSRTCSPTHMSVLIVIQFQTSPANRPRTAG